MFAGALAASSVALNTSLTPSPAQSPPMIVETAVVPEYVPAPLPTTTTTVPPPPPTTTTTAPPPPPPEPVRAEAPPATSGGGDPYDDASWQRLAQCESGGDWSINTGNGYYGGIQFSLASWESVGGVGYPHEASPSEQISRGRLLWEQGGWAHWPACTASFGWR